jgi:mannose-6-phosphate isomerase
MKQKGEGVVLSAPIRFEPIYVARPWGGEALGPALGRSIASVDPIGESWEISGYPGRVSRMSDGTGLDRLLDADPEALLGRPRRAREAFPLLFKYLDAREDLSIQVHPREPGPDGAMPKDEAWWVLEARPGAMLYVGFEREVDEEEVRRRARDGTLPEILRRVPARPGSIHRIRPGTVHGIGGGVVLAEIQQVSDTTYRLYDWDRRGLDGRRRDLHLDDALACAARRPVAAADLSPVSEPIEGGERLLRGPHFHVDRLRPRGREVALRPDGSFRIVAALGGRGRFVLEAGEFFLARGATWLLPACLESVQIVDDSGDLDLLLFGE